MLSLIARGSALALLNLVDFGTPFARMLMLSHWLSLRELGFASVLVATYGSFELMSDFAINRFVFSTPREKYREALASAHALSVVRGFTVGAAAIAVSPIVASYMDVEADWPDFALLGLVTIIRSFEHIGPRVAERDYRYGVQFKVSLLANGLGLAALVVALYVRPAGAAIIASLFAQAIGQVVGSHAVADTPYRIRFRSPLFREAFRFGYPLMLNGVGLAASTQGDRFVVGGMLGLSTLGVYAIATLATSVPVMMVGRLLSTVLLAALYNAAAHSETLYLARLRLAARSVPVVAAILGLGVVTLYNIVVPLVFGRNFVLTPLTTAILAFGAFLRLARGEPFTTMLMNQARTRRIALINLASTSALVFAVILVFFHPAIDSVLLAKLLGEVASFAAALYLTAEAFRRARGDYLVSMLIGTVALACAAVLSMTTDVGTRLLPSVAVLLALSGALLLWAWIASGALARESFPQWKLRSLKS
jgi:O-antigen/teichoic acid export membrane protein